MTLMRKARFAIPLLASLALPIAALPRPSFSIGTSAGLVSGTAREYVYEGDEKLSELVWPMEPVFVAGLEASLRWGGRLELSGSLDAGIPGDTGTLTDSDFMNIPASHARTHYSEHDSFLDHSFDLSATLAWRQDLPGRGHFPAGPIQIVPAIGFRYINNRWTGSDGYKQYGNDSDGDGIYTEWSEDLEKVAMSGKVISYEQEYWMPVAGLTLSVPLDDSLRVSVGVTASPWVRSTGTDHHLLRSLRFLDVMSGGYLVEPVAGASCRISSRAALFVDARWTRIEGLEGDSWEKADSAGSWTEIDTDGGAAFDALKFRIGITFTSD